MSEDRLVSMKSVKDAISKLFQFAPSHDEAVVVERWIGETFFKVEDVFWALDGVPKAEQVRSTDCMSLEPENVIHHRAICNELNNLYERKNRDYGDSFHKTYLEEGMAMARIRLTDKLERFKKLTREGGQEVKDESIRDTLIDMANYAIMTAMEMDRESAE